MIQTVENIGEKLVSMLTYDASQPLIFSSGLFLFLFAGFLFFYGFTRRAPMARIVYVILFSLYFYYKSSGIYFLLLVFASVSDYWIAHAIYKVRTQRAKYWLVGLSVLVNLGMLGYFKYTNFLIEIANNLFGQGFLNFQNIFLPVGISFFVFQSMSYTIDICRGQLKPLNNWADYLFYLSFFPQLVAGPIVRAKDFIPQIRQNPLRVTREMFGMGVFLILIGLFKKAVISDYISLNFVDRIFDEPLLYSGFECLMGIYATPCKSIATSRVTRIWPSASPCCWASAFRRTSTPPTNRPRSPNSGAGGTSRSPRGCAIISISRWAATARGVSAPISTCSSPCCSAVCGTGRPCASSFGERCTA